MTQSERHEKRSFNAGWRTTLLTVVLFPLMVGLGLWQIDRAEEKRSIQREAEQQQAMPPLDMDAMSIAGMANLRYRKVQFSCRWLPQYFLLDNQVQNGKAGYQVIGLVQLASGQHVLVNRGWQAMHPDRAKLPIIPPAGTGMETGGIFLADDLVKDEPVYAEQGWPRRIQRLHLPALAREAGVELLPFVIRLDQGSPSALAVHWPVINTLPEKHEAYAIQWFAMSAALLIFYIVLGFRKEEMPGVCTENNGAIT